MSELQPLIDALLRPLRRAVRGDPSGCGPEIATRLEAAAHAIAARGATVATGDLLDSLKTLPTLSTEEQAVVLAKAQRAALLLQSHAHSLDDTPAAPASASAQGPERPSRERPADDPLAAPAVTLRGVGPRVAERLAARGIETVGDLLRLLPRRFDDYRRGGKIADLREGEAGFAVGDVVSARSSGYRRRRSFRLEIADETSRLRCVWFRVHGGMNRIQKGQRVRVAGVPRRYQDSLEMHHPDLDLLEDGEEGASERPIVPRYPDVEGIAPKLLWRLIREALSQIAGVDDPLPEAVRVRAGLIPLRAALQRVHEPPADADLDALAAVRDPAQQRLIFEELFAMQLAIARASADRTDADGIPFRVPSSLAERVQSHLPFDLTDAQRRVLGEIRADMSRPVPMSRLLQGDVGAGKTVVALLAALDAVAGGHQAAVMAPTEVLAEQHYRVMSERVTGLGVNVILVTGSQSGAVRRAARREVEQGIAQIVVGTQAMLYESVRFDALGLCVVDEQHRFGVMQRAKLARKGTTGLVPDLLVMTATPIPRTLAMTVYGDLQVSVLDGKPPGRMPIETRVLPAGARERVYERLSTAVAEGAQAYVVVPLVSESEKLDVRDALRTHEELSAGVLGRASVGLLHGRMSAEEKRVAMQRFAGGEDRVLVSTTVMEVGVDVPGATILIVEHAERFGLAQLHQLRGRVGRGAGQSHCILLTSEGAPLESLERLATLARTDDGFEIAEADLQARGPGEILGTIQSGTPPLLISDLRRDTELLAQARKSAFDLVADDPRLVRPENRRAWTMLAARYGPLLELTRVA